MNIYFFLASLLVLTSFSVIFSIDDDVKCLEGIQASLKDPEGKLSWSFANPTVESICKLNGVSCWNQKEARIISLDLGSMQLSGRLPESLNLCHSLQTLNLSNNDISGPIPVELCSWLPYIVTLDLSNNQLSGPIPSQIVGCEYLNKLVLSNNKLSGSIPYEVGRLDRLREFSVAGNALSGSIPSDLAKFKGESFEGNKGLCGNPLGKCRGSPDKDNLSLLDEIGQVETLLGREEDGGKVD
ncbi:probable inactive receptor kinase At1g27190 isoform X2 [Mangifera indica]|uniref:probable inactive receptor kinase At1g27190 isoform X2 n=1 Tax=Mangifera indica TaxID=29780 RepID=UPI001CFBED4F|nr:probable inactive receptor kinase At1g27190 isoform X2 [Mangifera indica]XP_044480879.1 probable inactive receptor kinase At1g27190 isoform X2 [Mangifera indica]